MPNILKMVESGESQGCSNNLMDVINKTENKCTINLVDVNYGPSEDIAWVADIVSM